MLGGKTLQVSVFSLPCPILHEHSSYQCQPRGGMQGPAHGYFQDLVANPIAFIPIKIVLNILKMKNVYRKEGSG